MENYGEHINALIAELSKLPGIGRKSALRLAFYIIERPTDEVKKLTKVISTAREKIRYCKCCHVITDREICPVCDNPKRNKKIIMVVESTADMMAYEKTKRYEGVYHVLNGVISPRMQKGPDEIFLKELIVRLQAADIEEVIIATNADLEGETTALFIAQLLKASGIKITRIASGVPVGGDIENIDEITLFRAFEGRVEI